MSSTAARGLALTQRLHASRVAPSSVWGLEWHHDGTGDLDVSMLGPPLHGGQEFAGIAFTAGRWAAWEYDVDAQGSPHLAGVFYQPLEPSLPDLVVSIGPPPVLIGFLDGRQGQVRLLYAVEDPDALTGLMERLQRVGPPDLPIDALAPAAELLERGVALRVGVEYVADVGISSRLGIEVVADPFVVDIGSGLARLGAGPSAIAEMHRLASMLPISRVHGRRIDGLGGITIDRVADAIGFVHVSLSWAGGPARLKSYLMVTSTPVADPRLLASTDGR